MVLAVRNGWAASRCGVCANLDVAPPLRWSRPPLLLLLVGLSRVRVGFADDWHNSVLTRRRTTHGDSSDRLQLLVYLMKMGTFRLLDEEIASRFGAIRLLPEGRRALVRSSRLRSHSRHGSFRVCAAGGEQHVQHRPI